MNQAPVSADHAPDNAPEEEGSFFRCPVQPEQSSAVIRVGHRKIAATVQEISIDGLTVLVTPKNASKLTIGRPWVLEHDGTRIEIFPQWFFNAPDGHVQMGLRRLRDLTPPDPIKSSLLAKFGGSRYTDPSYSAIAFGGFVLFLFSLMSLPGLGDRLGTAQRIQDTVRWAVQEIDAAIDMYL